MGDGPVMTSTPSALLVLNDGQMKLEELLHFEITVGEFLLPNMFEVFTPLVIICLIFASELSHSGTVNL